MITKAVLLAAGRGTRLGALTAETPKPLLDVGGRPVIVRILEGLVAAGIREAVVVTGHLADALRRGIEAADLRGVRLEFRRQETLDGTARALALARDFVGDDTFFFGWGDIVVRPENYATVLRAAVRDVAAVIAVNEVDDPAGGAAVYVDDALRVQRIVEKPPPGTSSTRWNNAGFGVLTARAWPAIEALKPSPRGEYELPQAIAALAGAGEKVVAVPVEGPWIDIGTPEDLEAARRAFA